MQDIHNVRKASLCIEKYIVDTPVITSDILNSILGHNIFFKLDCFQVTGSFKVRGVLNYFLSLKHLPEKVVASSTGNNAIGVSFLSQKLGIECKIYVPKTAAKIKIEKAIYYGAKVHIVESVTDISKLMLKDVELGYTSYPSSEHEDVIAGAGTVCYDALLHLQEKSIEVDAIFASCATGGMLSGSLLAKNLIMPHAKLFGVEPSVVDDALRSIITNTVVPIRKNSDMSIADGLNIGSIATATLPYLKKLDGFFLVQEEEIKYWTSRVMQLAQVQSEAACGINMAAVKKWIDMNKASGDQKRRNILVIISGGNVDFTSLAHHHCSNISDIACNRSSDTTEFFDLSKN
ncbi:pyridoxal-phosphate dependent enzyme [Candidatus Sneabacter namystus]|uniref:Pyridoxal-phosphate dependent enzyme n=1 Tax=Candidatus Sneabacter namystus TaxID=2601646 RepID=A0A5C0UJQ5_9RICK|nr:pyridoxal-phosphate dependent enzyme [Candidatus Sneabacter namystus]QEK39712.1 pyridoxal-phosphate dependent enzyme [Candidatus Sneabacter namystus]